MQTSLDFFEKRIGGSFHYQNYWMDRYAWEIRTKVFFDNVGVKGKKILDFGSGDGSWGQEFLIRGASKVLGIEQSKKICKMAKIHSIIMKELEKNDKKFDIVTAITALNFTNPEDRVKIINVLKGVLKPKGKIVIIEYLPKVVPSFQKNLSYKYVWTKHKWINICEKEGLVLSKAVPVNWIDTTIFHYLRSSIFTYWLTKLVDKLLYLLRGTPKYWLLIFKYDNSK